MIKIGDKVRFANKYLAKSAIIAPGQKHGRHWYKRHRGDQRVMTVIDIRRGAYDWRQKKYSGDLVLVDRPYDNLTPFSWINVYWLRLVRREKIKWIPRSSLSRARATTAQNANP